MHDDDNALTLDILILAYQHPKSVFFVRPRRAPRAENPMGVSQGREQRGKDWNPEDPGAGRGGQCHHQSCELRVSLQGYLVA